MPRLDSPNLTVSATLASTVPVVRQSPTLLIVLLVISANREGSVRLVARKSVIAHLEHIILVPKVKLRMTALPVSQVNTAKVAICLNLLEIVLLVITVHQVPQFQLSSRLLQDTKHQQEHHHQHNALQDITTHSQLCQHVSNAKLVSTALLLASLTALSAVLKDLTVKKDHKHQRNVRKELITITSMVKVLMIAKHVVQAHIVNQKD